MVLKTLTDAFEVHASGCPFFLISSQFTSGLLLARHMRNDESGKCFFQLFCCIYNPYYIVRTNKVHKLSQNCR
jgi:ribosomal protein S27AE